MPSAEPAGSCPSVMSNCCTRRTSLAEESSLMTGLLSGAWVTIGGSVAGLWVGRAAMEA